MNSSANSAWWLLPRFCLDENTNPPAGGAPAGGGTAPPSASPGTAGGGGAAPAEAPAEGPSGEAGDPFAGMDDDLDSIDLGLSEPPTPGEGGDQPTPPPAPAAPGAVPAAPQGVQQPAAPAPPAQVPPENVGAAPPRSQVDVALEGFKTNQKELSEWASQNLFALSKEDAEALDSDVVAQIPKLMGRVYTAAIQASTNLIKNFVPEMINSGVMGQQQRTARAAEALSQFYSANPHLNAQAHGASVDKWARAFRAANPTASRQDAIAFVGRAVSAEHNLAPGVSNGSGRPQPFTPARPGGRAPQTQQVHDPYAGMEDEYD